MTSDEHIAIRPFVPEDQDAVARIARRSFSALWARLIVPGPEDFVATVDNRVAGAVLLNANVTDMSGQERVGRIAWLFTDPDYRGRGLARQLVKQGVEQLRAQGCGPVVTEVEGYNTPSANIFHELGFRRLGTMDQVRWLGVAGALLLGLRTNRLFTPGHFLWALDVPGRPASPAVQRAGTWTLNVFITLLALLLGGGLLLPGGPVMPGASEILAVIVAVVLLLGLREGAMQIAARMQGLQLEFRGWGSGAAVSALIAVLFGKVFLLPGSCYPPGDGWHYHQFRRQLALSAAAGTSMVVILFLSALVLPAQVPEGFAPMIAGNIVEIGIALILFDSIIAFEPFQGYSARRMLDYSRTLWIAFALIVAVIYVFVVILG
ncbi:MAG: GNAT family N-acetyltransferase [Methanolobus sp.]|nr:GNAT family N-acetyltransferase [Methanolobus sp.]